jgi:type I restriction enzyme S subunit
MGSEWSPGQLSEIAEIIMGQSPSGDTCNSKGIGKPLLNGPTEFGSHHPVPAQFTTDPKKVAVSGDILFCVRGSTTGRMNWADQQYAIGRGIAAIRHNGGHEYQSFLRGIIENRLPLLLASATGSTFPNVSRNQLLELEIDIPPLPEQRAIAHILGSLDDKIELNRQMNETLEAMAQALFKSWFIDFDPVIDNALAAGHPIPEELQARAALRESLGDALKPLPDDLRNLFPGEFEFTQEMGWIPKGWEVKTVGEVLSVVGGGTPSTSEPSYWEHGTHLFCTPKDMSSLVSPILIDTERKLTKKGVTKISSGLLPIGTVLLSSRAPIGYLAITDEPMTINQGIIAMLGNAHFSSLYVKCWTGENIDKILSRANGSTFLEISKKNFRPIPFVVPTPEIVDIFDRHSREFHTRLISCTRNIAELTQLRDTLLPKLLSGEIRIPEAEKLVEATK